MVRFSDFEKGADEDAAKLAGPAGGAPEGPPAEAPPDADAPAGMPDSGEGLTPEERRMLAGLSAGPAAEGRPAAEPSGAPRGAEEQPTGAAPRGGEPPTAPPAETGLTSEEKQVLSQVRDESERVSREELPAMFEKEGKAVAMVAPQPAELVPPVERPPAAGTEAKTAAPKDKAADVEAPAQAVTPPGVTGLLKVLAVPLDIINRPFRWMDPVWRTGLGLCGVLLLITLLLVILVRMLAGQ